MRAIFKIDICELYAGQSRVPTTSEPGYRHCPQCGGVLEERLLKGGDPVRLVCTACEFVFYLDPKVAVGTIVTTPDGRIVLVRRAIEPGYGLWVFPGGYVDRGETVTAAALRETREEAGLEVRLDGLVNIYSYPGRPIIIIVYAASIVSGELRVDEESLEAGLFAPADIPWNDLAFVSTRDALRDFLDGRLGPV
jgi:8-oxo-dGTP diphosphatase